MKVLILAGGFGTRLWPLSTKRQPKQFLALFDHRSLLKATVERVRPFSEPSEIFIAATEEQKGQVLEQVEEIGVPLDHIIAEPASKNTAAALAFAFKSLLEENSELEKEPFLICPSDHWMENDPVRFGALLATAKAFAQEGSIVTFGIRPDYPETGYGYMLTEGEEAPFSIVEFKEKPDIHTARKYVESGKYYWNSGMFLLTPETFFSALEANAPQLFTFFSRPMDIIREQFSALVPISFDIAVMEKAAERVMLPLDIPWSDIGSWESIWRAFPKDEHQNVLQGQAEVKDAKRCVIVSESIPVLAVGVSDLMVVQTEDAILVAPRGLPDTCMRTLGEGVAGRTEFRPWGNYTVLAKGGHSLTKRIRIDPKKRTSLQTHKFRDEHWVVVQGVLEATVGETTGRYLPNQSLFIPKGVPHRISNPGDVPLEIIEVQMGDELSEDDIVRIEDDFGRVEVPLSS